MSTDFREIEVPVAKIRTDGGTQARVKHDAATLREYREAIVDGVELPRIDLFFDRREYWLADGFYRLDAHKREGLASIRARVRYGSRTDAILFACGANAGHGLRRSNADKRNAVRLAFLTLFQASPEDRPAVPSDSRVAELCKVSDELAADVRAELVREGALPSDAPTAGRDGRVIDATNIGKRADVTDPGDEPTPRNREVGTTANATEYLTGSTRPAAERDTAPDFYGADPEDKPPTLDDVRSPFDRMIRQLGELRNLPASLADGDPVFAAWFDEGRRDEWQRRVGNVQEVAKAARPHALCGYCNGAKCGKCRETGYLPYAASEAAPKPGQKLLPV